MKTEAIIHSGLSPDLYVSGRSILHIGIRAAREDLRSCELIFFTRTAPEHKMRRKMNCRLRDAQADYYETKIQFPVAARYLKYYFALTGRDGETVWMGAGGIYREEPSDGFFEFAYANEKDCITIPRWAAGQIYYQIFPERFCNGDEGNDPQPCMPWGSRPDREHYMGGDLAGIYEKLPYLEKLGVECLYLTPVFKADFNHKYATEDYFQIDPDFGTKEMLTELVKACHERNMKIILDGVFNHCGVKFAPFADLLEKQEQSEYRDWFYITQYPVTIAKECYECVGAYPWMPKLNTGNRRVRQYILEVMRYWLKEAGIDGWRLDVADEVDGSVWLQARIELKEEFPDCLLLGETWGSGYRMMLGNQMDSIMNYGFLDAVKEYLLCEKPDAEAFSDRINRVYSFYPKIMTDGLYHMLGSHDTPRFRTLCGKDGKRLELAVALQMLLPGSPAVYYGEEAGMEGENDPGCRGAFPWEEKPWEKPLFAWYQKLIRLRKKEQAFRTGDYGTILCEGGTYGFYRKDDNAVFYIVCNPDISKKLNLPVLKKESCKLIFPAESADGTVMETVPIKEGQKFYNDDVTDYKGTISVKAPEWSVFVIKQSHKISKEEKV